MTALRVLEKDIETERAERIREAFGWHLSDEEVKKKSDELYRLAKLLIELRRKGKL